MRIYVVRHGETEGNKNGLVIGRTDEPLNDTGRKQAEELGMRLRGIPFSACYASPLQRAVDTAKIALNAMNCDCPIIAKSCLTEQNYGFLEGSYINSREYMEHKDKLFQRFPHGESYMDIVARVYPFMTELIRSSKEDRFIFIVTHGQPCKVIDTFFRDVYEEDFRSMYVDNCQFTVYTTRKRSI